jgi:hypothetical protein
MEENDIEQYKALLEDVEEVKKALKIDSTDTALLLMMYDQLLEVN